MVQTMRADVRNGACGLFPSHSKDWWPMTEDIFGCPSVSNLKRNLMSECIDHDEMQCLSIDATMRCCMLILGQARLKATAAEREAAAFGEEQSYRRVSQPAVAMCVCVCACAPVLKVCITSAVQLTMFAVHVRKVFTVRGRTNCVLLMRACATEQSETACALLSESLPAAALRQAGLSYF